MGGDGQPHDRKVVGQQVEGSILRFAPDVTLMHVTASADVIAKRMRENPHSNSHFKEEDIQHALDWFAEASERCLFSHKINAGHELIVRRRDDGGVRGEDRTAS